MNTELTVEQIMAFKGQIDKDNSISVVTDRNGNRYGVKAVTEYVAGFFSGLENGEALIAANQPAVGVRSIKGTQLGEGRHQVLTAVRVLTDTSQALETTAALIALPFASVAPVQFKNGEFKISQGAELLRTSGTDVHNFKASTSNDDDFRNIVPVVLRGGVDMSINIKLAGAATAGHAYKIELRSIEFLAVGKS
jgi:hypothetical protein